MQLCLSAPFLLFCIQQLPALCPALGVPSLDLWLDRIPLLVDPTATPSYQRQQQEWLGEYRRQKGPPACGWKSPLFWPQLDVRRKPFTVSTGTVMLP